MNKTLTPVVSKINKARLSQAEKDAHDKQWYKDKADQLDSRTVRGNIFGFSDTSIYKSKKVNYDLFNDIIDVDDFIYVCKPFGSKVGDLPANFTNRDIVSGKIKVLLGMEMKMPFSWKVIATNEEATTRKEQEEYGRIRDYVVNEIMRPIKIQIETQAKEQSKGQKLTPEEQQQIEQQIAEETQAQTPDEVRKYMTREHQDPAEVMHKQLLEYLIQKEKVQSKFNKGFKHLNLGAKEVYHIGIFNGEPRLTVVNGILFNSDNSPELDYIEDGEWAVCEYPMTPSQILANWSDELTDEQIDRIYDYEDNGYGTSEYYSNLMFTEDGLTTQYTISARHLVWKSPQKIGFLTYVDRRTGQKQEDIVNEDYEFDESQGDIEIKWDWIPQVHECWKIFNDIYVGARPVPGQNRDLDNLYEVKLPYYGAVCDNLNSIPTCPMDRMKSYQYFYDVIIYRIELLMASDKGKILAANINAIPKSSGINTAKFMYFMEANKIAFFNPKEEGNRQGGDITNLVKEIDMSMASDISKYIQLAEYIEKKCGSSIGITPQMEAQIGANDAVTNTQQNLIQASHIIQPYFELHNNVKGNVLRGLLETAKVAYSDGKKRKLSYVLDDMSVRLLTVDQGMLQGTTIGLFVSNSTKADEAKTAIMNLSQAAMQNQQIDLLDVMKIIRSNDINDAAEDLEVGQQKKIEQQQASDKAKLQQQRDAEMRADTLKREQWDHEKEMVILKAEEDRKTKVQVETIAAMGYDTNKDEDNDGVPDTLEVAKFGVDADIKKKQLDQKDAMIQLDKDKFQHQKENDAAKNKIELKKLNKPKS